VRVRRDLPRRSAGRHPRAQPSSGHVHRGRRLGAVPRHARLYGSMRRQARGRGPACLHQPGLFGLRGAHQHGAVGAHACPPARRAGARAATRTPRSTLYGPGRPVVERWRWSPRRSEKPLPCRDKEHVTAIVAVLND
jgi:hypothetical protein